MLGKLPCGSHNTRDDWGVLIEPQSHYKDCGDRKHAHMDNRRNGNRVALVGPQHRNRCGSSGTALEDDPVCLSTRGVGPQGR